VRVGIYADMRNPPRWRRPWAAHYGATMDRIAEAERLGADSVWVTEHHFFEDGYLPQPLTMAAAIAGRTSRIRVGTAVLLAPLRSPLQIAEEAAIVDLVSVGRLELGLGAGYRLPEFAAFGVDPARRFALLRASVREVRRLWEEGGCTPPPVQDPVPMWLGVMTPRGARAAGRLGTGLLWLDEALLGPYREGLAEGGHDPSSARMSGLAMVILADDPEEAWARIRPHLAYQRDTYARYGREGTAGGDPSSLPPTLVRDAEGRRRDREGPGAHARPPRLHVLAPEEAIPFLGAWLARMPVDHVFVWDSIAGMPDDLADRHVELVATRLRPALAGEGPQSA
jgi:alkanesulfonate monooxygenase SsuD/methylene tetrahydromethanopterin reductase-like flavin-dependent oxidoreductase (luciferase family)